MRISATFPLGILFLSLLLPLKALTWRHASSEHFEVLSALSESETQSLLVTYEQQCLIFDALFQKAPKENTKIAFVYCPAGDSYAPFLRAEDRSNYRVYPMGVYPAPSVYPVLIAPRNRYDDAGQGGPTEIYLRTQLVSRLTYRAPSWLVKGITDCFTSLEIGKTEYQFGRHNVSSYEDLRQMGALPLKVLFDEKFNSSEEKSETFRNRWQATSWVFVHFCLFGRPDILEKNFFRFVQLMTEDALEPRSKLFQEAFGLSCEEMDKALARYIKEGKFTLRKGKVPPKESIKVTHSPLSQLESDAFWTFAKLQADYANRQAVGTQKFVALMNDLMKGENTFLLLWGSRLGAALNVKDLAKDGVERVLKLGTDNPLAYTLALDLELTPRVVSFHWDIMLSPEQSETLRQQVDRGLEIDPDNAELLSDLATVEALSKTIRYDKINLLQKKMRSIPDKSRAMAMLALIRYRGEDYDTVRSIQASGLVSSRAEKVLLEKILKAIEAKASEIPKKG